MPRSKKKADERVFIIELLSKGDVRNVALDSDERVFIEGSLGPLVRAQFVEDLVLEVTGSKGVLRVDLSMMDLGIGPASPDGTELVKRH